MKYFEKIFLNLYDLCKHHKYFVTLLSLVTFLTYGFMGIYITYNNDICYFLDVQWDSGFSFGRWGTGILSFLGLVNIYLPFWNCCLGMFFWLIATLLWGMLFYDASERKISKEAIYCFMLLFATHPLHYEIFIYPAAFTLHAIAFLLLALGAYRLLAHDTHFSAYITGGLLLGLVFSIYEVYAVVFLLVSLFVFIIRKYFKFFSQRKDTISYIKNDTILLVMGLVFFYIGAQISQFFFGHTEGPAREIVWFQDLGNIMGTLGLMAYHLLYDYAYNGIFYFCILLFLVSVFLFGIYCWKYPSGKLIGFSFFLCSLFLVFSLSFLLGKSMPYRMAQPLIMFSCLSFMLFWDQCLISKKWRYILLVVIVFYQCKEINLWAFHDYRVSEYNIACIRKLGFDIQSRFGRKPEKKIVICGGGSVELPIIKTTTRQLFNNIPKHYHVNQHAGMAYFGKSDQFYKLFPKITGLDLYENKETLKHYESVIEQSKIPQWPQSGYITEQKDCILVNLGDSFLAEKHLSPAEYLKNFLPHP